MLPLALPAVHTAAQCCSLGLLHPGLVRCPDPSDSKFHHGFKRERLNKQEWATQMISRRVEQVVGAEFRNSQKRSTLSLPHAQGQRTWFRMSCLGTDMLTVYFSPSLHQLLITMSYKSASLESSSETARAVQPSYRHSCRHSHAGTLLQKNSEQAPLAWKESVLMVKDNSAGVSSNAEIKVLGWVSQSLEWLWLESQTPQISHCPALSGFEICKTPNPLLERDSQEANSSLKME